MPRRKLDGRQRARAKRLGEHLARSRTKRGLSQEALARSVDVSVDTLRSVEQHRTAEPSFFLVAALARPLGLSLDDIARTAEPRK
jgi:DNA-binding XRE family transcriptional regulator